MGTFLSFPILSLFDSSVLFPPARLTHSLRPTVGGFGSIVRMSSRAMSFLAVHVTHSRTVNHTVLGRSDGFKMLRVNAGTLSTGVVDDIIIWDSSVKHKPSYAMRSSVSSLQKELSVAVPIKITIPENTIAVLRGFRIKSLLFSFAKLFHNPVYHKDVQGDNRQLGVKIWLGH